MLNSWLRTRRTSLTEFLQYIVAGLDPADITGALLLILLATTTPFPAEIAALAVAMKHSFATAFILIWSGAMTGAALSYCLALWFGKRPAIANLRAVRRAHEGLEDLCWNGRLVWVAVLGLRLIPLVPFFALSLAAGILRISPSDYFRGTALGILPACIVLSLAGQGLISGNIWIITLTVLGLLLIAVLLYLGLRHHRRQSALQRHARNRIDVPTPSVGETEK